MILPATRSWTAVKRAALVVLSLLLAPASWALGLGEIDVRSALNERLNASIELLDAGDLQKTEIFVSLASSEDFERVGVERFFFLTDMQFEVDLSGRPKVQVTSSRPVSEPYLNFIVELVWPSGRVLKEFTVLLDPPTFSDVAAADVVAPVQSAPAPTPSADRGQVSVPAAPATPSRSSQAFMEDQLLTTRDDTLWKIANRTRGGGIDVNQQMLAIQKLNPRAFMRNNINLLKAGYRLEMPSPSQAGELTPGEAATQVNAQTNSWRTGVDYGYADANPAPRQEAGEEELASQLSAAPAASQPASVVDSSEGDVRIVATTGDQAIGTGGGEEVNSLIEEKEALNRRLDELSYELDREKEIANNQISVKDRQLEVKDQEIAQLQQQLEQSRKALQERQNQRQSTATSAEDVPWWQTPWLLYGVIGVLTLLLAGLLLLLRRNRAEQEALEDYLELQEDEAIEPDVDASDDDVMVAALDLDDGVQDTAEPYIDEVPDETLDLSDDLEELAAQDDGEDEDFLNLESDVEDEDALEAVEDSVPTDTSDVFGEADIYIAYGRFGQAANLLLGVLGREPERHDVRLKLLEVYAEANDEAEFASHAQYLLDNCDDESVLMAVRDLEGQLSEAQVDAGVGGVAAVAAADDALSSDADSELEDELDLGDLDDLEGLDDLESLDEVEEIKDEVADTSDEVADLLDADDDFELEFDDLEEPGAEVAVAGDSLDAADDLLADLDDDLDLDGDLGDNLDGNFDADPAADRGMDFDADADVDTSDDGGLDDLLAGLDDDLEDEPNLSEAVIEAADAQPELAAADDDFDFDADPEEDFEFESPSEEDANETKLDLAEAYIDMGDGDGARDILDEVLNDGSDEQQQRAREMLSQIS